MIFQYCSDLHLEFPENKLYLQQHPIQKKADILILGGDVVPFSHMHLHHDFFDLISTQFEHTYWIPGNHEYYYADINERSGSFTELIRPNITLLNNEVIRIQNTSLIFSTLWTYISAAKSAIIQNRLSDFFIIQNGPKKLDVETYNRMHETNLEFLKNAITHAQTDKTIVVTHHLPTFKNYPAKFVHSPINQAFATELEQFIHIYQPDYWLYGHSHVNTPAFDLGKTKLMTNQLGYVRYQEHTRYEPAAIITV